MIQLILFNFEMLKKKFLRDKTNIRDPRKSLPNSNDVSLKKMKKYQSVYNIKQSNLINQSLKNCSKLQPIRKKNPRKSCDETPKTHHISTIKSQNTSPNRISYQYDQNDYHKKNRTQKNVNLESMMNEKYKFIYRIGFGGLGKVWKVQESLSLKTYAMKCIAKKKVIEKDSIESILNQRIILSYLEHPFIINMKKSFQDKQNLYLVMDYLRGGDLRYHICYKESFNQLETKFIIACIILGLQYIHQKQLLHRDIKPENIVFEQNGYLRITDFGIAKQLIGQNTCFNGEPSGTPGYMAPQVICKTAQSAQSDYFSLGIIVYELMFGRRPYVGANRAQIRNHMLSTPVKIDRNNMPKKWSSQGIQFIEGLTQRNPQKRLGHSGINELKQHKWMKNMKWQKLSEKKLKPPFVPDVICQSRQYLNQIQTFAQLDHQHQKYQQNINLEKYQHYFQDYDYEKLQVSHLQQKKKYVKPKNDQNRKTSYQ